MVVIRDACAADAGALAELAERTFRDTFGAANTDEDMDAHCAENFGKAPQLAEIANTEWCTLLAEEGDLLIGYGQLRWSSAPGCISSTRAVEIYRLYVDARWHGRGVAPMLMTSLLERAATGDTDTVWLGVWEHNPRALAYYRKAGFREVGEHSFMLGGDAQRDIVMSLALTA